MIVIVSGTLLMIPIALHFTLSLGSGVMNNWHFGCVAHTVIEILAWLASCMCAATNVNEN